MASRWVYLQYIPSSDEVIGHDNKGASHFKRLLQHPNHILEEGKGLEAAMRKLQADGTVLAWAFFWVSAGHGHGSRTP